MLPPPPPDRFPIFLYLSISINHITVLYWRLNMLNCCHSRQEDARGKGSELTCAELVLFFLFCFQLPVRLCRTQRKTAPTGGRRSKREGESWVARRRSQISQWLHGVMYLWSAAMDCNPRSLLFILPLLLSHVFPAFSIIYPPNEGKRTLSLWTCVFKCMCAHPRACVGVWVRVDSARRTSRTVPGAHGRLSNF